MKLKKEYFEELINFLIYLEFSHTEEEEYYTFYPDSDEPELLNKIIERYCVSHITPERQAFLDEFYK